ncbi:hypothetical protein [Streptomyces sp. NRRL S-378]|uniref:hypothetical protein n=1 Tax=Streptomyces sp. NRRL S-378 TaxID=1463904 RepID=UPI0004C87BD3|nr:hypothetical protein [Streptomyces sp. NRRL S-378]
MTEEHSLTSPARSSRAANTDGTAVLDTSPGVLCGFWPQGDGWDAYLPSNTWDPGGEGSVTEFDHPNASKVVVCGYMRGGTSPTRIRPTLWTRVGTLSGPFRGFWRQRVDGRAELGPADDVRHHPAVLKAPRP